MKTIETHNSNRYKIKQFLDMNQRADCCEIELLGAMNQGAQPRWGIQKKREEKNEMGLKKN